MAEPQPASDAAVEADGDAARASADGGSTGVTLLEWVMPSPIERAVILVPRGPTPEQRFPVVIALHGRGEAMKGPALGAMGWPRDYALERAFARMASPPLVEQDFEGLVENAHLAEMNRALAARRFGGLIVACPYVPDIDLSSAEAMNDYGKVLATELLPRVRKETPALASAEATGIDGVSLGGIVALRVGLGRPEAFGAVGALQPAIRDSAAGAAELTELAKSARGRRPAMKLRLTTSERDSFRRAVNRTHEAWRASGIAHDFAVLPGPHDYVFNRGPGALELLFWHDQVLARGEGRTTE
ncbi:alpha/beta hydrolase [Pendulispora albinea]|uniref:Esterase n=1 Tax=Pendulispora albinea TaxID=2741071 RepID=A0ABZ2LTB2_9BACT